MSFVLHEISNNLLLNEEDIRNLLHNQVIEDANRNLGLKKYNVNATDICGCIKALYFKFKNIEPSNPPSYPYSPIVLNVGSVIHTIVEMLLKPEEKEVSIRCSLHGFNLNMRADAIYHNKVLHEYKTIDNIDEKTTCKEDHLKQAVIYTYLLNTYCNRSIEWIQIIYIARGKVNVKVFNIKVTPELMSKVKDRLDRQLSYLRTCLDTNTIPSFENEFCKCSKFCEYYEFCKSLSS